MYSDPARIRNHTVNVRLSDIEYAIIRQFVDQTGGQLAAVLRELALERLTNIEQDVKQEEVNKEDAKQFLKRTG